MAAAQQPVKSAERALTVLEFLSERGPSSFSTLLEALELPRSSASTLLGTLEGSGWVERDASRRYTVGLRAWQVGKAYRGHEDLARRALPIMEALAASSGETVQLARLDGIENVYVAIAQSSNPMRLASSVGMRLPSHATGIGKALLSQLDPDEQRRRLSSAELPRLTSRTITDVESLLQELGEARSRGFAVDDEEYVEGCRCVAVPVPLGDLDLTAAISITSPAFRTPASWPESVVPGLVESAAAIRRALGVGPQG